MFKQKRILHGLFFCHLVIEKALKAHVVKGTNEMAPKTHNLLYLSELVGLNFYKENEIFLGILMKYQLQGRYPDYNPFIPDRDTVDEYFIKTQEILKWLKQRL